MLTTRRQAIAMIALALYASGSAAQSPAKPKPRPVAITYKARGGKMAKAEGTWTQPAKPGASMSAASAIATPNAAGGFAKVIPYVCITPHGKSCVTFNALDAAGTLLLSTTLSLCADSSGSIGNGTFDINKEATGLAQGTGIGIMQFTIGP